MGLGNGQFCWWPVLYLCWHSGWVRKIQNFADVIYRWSLSIQGSYTRLALKGNRRGILLRNFIISEKYYYLTLNTIRIVLEKKYTNFFCLEKNTSPPSGFKFLTQALDLRFSIFPRAISPSKFIGVICVSQNKLWALTIIRLIIWTMKWTLGFDTPLKILSFCRWNFLIADRCLHKQRNKEILQYYESN